MTSIEKTDFVYAIIIRTTPEKLWEALTNGEFSEQYWFGFRVQFDLKSGGKMHIAPPKGMEFAGDHAGEVLECVPCQKLVYTWKQADPPEIAAKRNGLSRVTYELFPMGEMVKLRLMHENLLLDDVESNPTTFRGINNGWPAVLSSLKSLLETGEAMAFKSDCKA
jgi:uncharacterized protein YndB with AHSA1/START domain